MKKVALITGASSGIGRELARIHAEHDGDLVIVARRKDKLDQLKKELESEFGVKVMVIVKDLCKEEAPKEIYDKLKKEKVQIDYLINNAGFGGQGKFHEREWKSDRNMIQLNVVALTNLCRLFLPDFMERNKGRILNVSSTASFTPGPLQAVYFATKTFVQFFSNAITEELKGTDVTVTNLMPGATETEFAKQADLEDTELFDKAFGPRGVAKDGYQAMLKGKMDVVSGVSFVQRIMFALIPIVPKSVRLKMVRKMQESQG